jgi:uncharacterized protein YktA (UPF0223 family)
MKIEKMHIKVKYCEVNKDNNFHIANSTYNPYKSTKRARNMQHAKIALTVLLTQ